MKKKLKLIAIYLTEEYQQKFEETKQYLMSNTQVNINNKQVVEALLDNSIKVMKFFKKKEMS